MLLVFDLVIIPCASHLTNHRFLSHTRKHVFLLTLEQGQGRELYRFALRAELGRTLRPLLLGLPDRLP